MSPLVKKTVTLWEWSWIKIIDIQIQHYTHYSIVRESDGKSRWVHVPQPHDIQLKVPSTFQSPSKLFNSDYSISFSPSVTVALQEWQPRVPTRLLFRCISRSEQPSFQTLARTVLLLLINLWFWFRSRNWLTFLEFVVDWWFCRLCSSRLVFTVCV